MRHFKIFCTFLLSVQAAISFAKEASLYNGNERMFRDQERLRVMNVLQSMGIPYRIASDKRIMVHSYAVNDLKEIVAQGFKAQSQRRVGETTTEWAFDNFLLQRWGV